MREIYLEQMSDVYFQTRFALQKAVKKLSQNDKQIAKMLIDKLLNDEVLDPKHKDHELTGQYDGFRECHVKPDLLLIYKKEKRILILICFAIGSHSELF